MKFSEQWVRSWCNPDISTEEMLEQLTMAGLEVDGMEPAGGAFTDVVVAKVESVEKHPDADKLNVCQVNDGSQTLQIVCGAANVRPGLIAPLARIGAELPGQKAGETFKIKPAKLRGVESSGMLCSEKELGLADAADGLMELPEDAPIGTNLRDYLELDDNIIEIDLTPNRGDCLSIAGVARELGVLNQCDVNAVSIQDIPASCDASFSVQMNAPEACTHYVGRVIKQVNVSAATPLWMVERLRRSGIRSLGAIVDITNYVMLELGQPMHAFDLAALNDHIDVRYAREGETITLLDGKQITLDEQTLLIADACQPLALAGIMGGEHSGVSDNTQDIFLESAFFRPEIIAGKARSYGLHTDSSHRFERGVDPQLQRRAIERATELVLQICGGEAGEVCEHTTDAHPQSNPVITLRKSRIRRLLGVDIEDDAIVDMLRRLEMQVTESEAGWQVIAPSFRFDINIEADLLEEIVRIYGYNNIPRNKPVYHANMQPVTEHCVPLPRLRQALVDRGYFEAITYSFVDPALQQIFDPDVTPVALANPLSSEMSVMRTTLWPGLVSAVRHNLNRQQQRVRLFETGLSFIPHSEGLQQVNRIAGAVTGAVQPDQWAQQSVEVDFFDIKGDVEALLAMRRLDAEFVAATHPALHPGQSAKVLSQGEVIGWLGALHPQVLDQLGVDQPVFVFELDLEPAQQAAIPAFKPLSKFPEVRRDLAIIVNESVTAGEIQAAIRRSASELLQEIVLFDVYTGKGIEPGQKSIAFGLILQDFSRTLTDSEIDRTVDEIVATLKTEFTATLRE